MNKTSRRGRNEENNIFYKINWFKNDVRVKYIIILACNDILVIFC